MAEYSLQNVENESYLMFDGSFRLAKDLKVGDLLMGADSHPCEIKEIDLVADENNYLVTPVKGESYIVGETHTLAINISGEKHIKEALVNKNIVYTVKWFDNSVFKFTSKVFNSSKYENSKKAMESAEEFLNSLSVLKRFGISVEKYLNLPNNVMHVTKGYKVPLDFPERPLKIDPYILGAYLGDGGQRDGNITSVDEEIINYFRKYFEQIGLVLKKRPSDITYGITTGKNGGGKGCNPFRTFLKENKINLEKHIPNDYLFNSKENRLKLLAGLLDTDGSLSDGNIFDFIQKREKLFDQILFLARSLGFSCYKNTCQKTCTNSKTKYTGTYHRCSISGDGLEQIPTLLPRKRATARKQVKDVLVTGIELTKLPSFPTYRIITDPNRKLFLMSDLTVRHSYQKPETVSKPFLLKYNRIEV